MGLTCGSHIVAEPVPSEPTSLKGEGKAVPLEQAVADDGKGSRLVLLGASTVAESGGEPLYTSIRPFGPARVLQGAPTRSSAIPETIRRCTPPSPSEKVRRP